MLIGGSIDTQLGKDLQRLWEGFPQTMLILGMGQLTLNFERIHKDFGTIPSDNVDPGMGGGPLTLNLERIHKDFGRLPLTMLIPGGLIDTQLGKDPQRLWEDYLWQCWSGGSIDTQLGKDLQRLWEDSLWQCWSWGEVDRHSTWKGSAKTLGGFPLTMLIGGSIDTQLGKDLQRLWKDSFWQCWSSGQWGVNTQLGKDPQRLREDCLWQCWSGGSIDTQLGKDLQRLWEDSFWQCWSWGLNWHSTWKWSTKTLEGLPLTMLILGGWSTLNLERIHKDFGRITSDNVDQGGQLTLNLERICKDFGRIASDNIDPGDGWLTLNLERIHKDFGRIASDNVDQGAQLTLNLERICKDFGRIASDNVDSGLGGVNTQLGKDPQRLWEDYLWQCWSWGGWSTLNLERICKDFGRIPSDNVDQEGQLTLNLKRIRKDFGRIPSDNVDPWGVNRHSTWKWSTKTLEGLPLTMLILGVNQHSTWK